MKRRSRRGDPLFLGLAVAVLQVSTACVTSYWIVFSVTAIITVAATSTSIRGYLPASEHNSEFVESEAAFDPNKFNIEFSVDSRQLKAKKSNKRKRWVFRAKKGAKRYSGTMIKSNNSQQSGKSYDSRSRMTTRSSKSRKKKKRSSLSGSKKSKKYDKASDRRSKSKESRDDKSNSKKKRSRDNKKKTRQSKTDKSRSNDDDSKSNRKKKVQSKSKDTDDRKREQRKRKRDIFKARERKKSRDNRSKTRAKSRTRRRSSDSDKSRDKKSSTSRSRRSKPFRSRSRSKTSLSKRKSKKRSSMDTEKSRGKPSPSRSKPSVPSRSKPSRSGTPSPEGTVEPTQEGSTTQPTLKAAPTAEPTPKDSATIEPTNEGSGGDGPGLVCNGLTEEQRVVAITERLALISPIADLLNPEIPVGMAYEYVISSDPLQVCPDDEPTLTQRYVLSALYFSTAGSDWFRCYQGDKDCTLGSSWLTGDESECFWSGVDCDEDTGYITDIVVSENNLDGTLPIEMESLDNLDVLALERNSLKGSLPSKLNGRLIALDLTSNKITGILSDAFIESIPRLKQLELGDNMLEGEIPASLANLESITIVRLEGNSLKGTMPDDVCEAREENEEWRILSVECTNVKCDCCTPQCDEEPPSRAPTRETDVPTGAPSGTKATDSPTPLPSMEVDFPPTSPPIQDTAMPTPIPTAEPTRAPTIAPTNTAPVIAPITSSPSNAPVVAPQSAPVVVPTPGSREDQIFLQLTNITSPSLLADPESPQGRAYDWIVTEDDLQLNAGDPTLDQRYILATLYYATNGNEWTECFQGATNDECGDGAFPEANSFLSSTSECTWGYWTGGSCNSEGQLRVIQIPDNNMMGTLPHEIASLPALDTLSLEKNNISGPLLEMWPASLFRLRLSKNSLTGTVSAGFPSTMSLLYLDQNLLSGLLDDLIGGLQDTTQLHLQSNDFRGTIPESLGDLTTLLVARFEENNLSGSMPKQVCTNREENPNFRFLVTDCPPEFECSCCSNRCRSL